jgi:hypothetical protein
LPERLEWLTVRLREKARDERSDKNLDRLRMAVVALEGKMSRCRSRPVEVRKDMVPEVEAQIRQTRQAPEAARKALQDAETADPVRVPPKPPGRPCGCSNRPWNGGTDVC